MSIPGALKTLYSTGDKNFAEIVRHTFWALVILAGTTIIQFVFDLLLTHNFKAHGSGIFYLSFSVLLILALIGRLGMDRAVVRFIPPLLKTDPSAAAGVNYTATKLSLILTVPLAIVFFLLAPFLAVSVFHSSDLVPHFRIFAFAIPALALNYVYSGTLRALKKTQSALSIQRTTMYFVGILSILTVGQIFGLIGVTIGFTVGVYLSTLSGLVHIRRHFPAHSGITPFSKKLMLVTSGPLLFTVFATQMNGQASVLLLGAFSSNSEVSIFNIALKISLLMGLLLTAINAIAATKVAELYAARDKKLNVMISKVSALATVCGIPMFLVLSIFAPFWMGLFGSQFVVGASALVILNIGQLVSVSVGSTDYVLAMTGHERALAAAVGISLGINLLLGVLFIPSYGVVGAAMAASATNAISNIIMVFMVKKYLGVWQLPFYFLNQWFRKVLSTKTGV